MPSLVAEIGEVIHEHLISIGIIKEEKVSKHVKNILINKRKEFDNKENDFPENAQLCKKCNTKAAIQMDGCMTCLNCGDSKCS